MAVLIDRELLKKEPYRLAVLICIVALHIGVLVLVDHGGTENVLGHYSARTAGSQTVMIMLNQTGMNSESEPVTPVSEPDLSTPNPPQAEPEKPEPAESFNASDTPSARASEQQFSSPQTSSFTVDKAHYYTPPELSEKPTVAVDASESLQFNVPDVFPQPVVVHLFIDEQGDMEKVVLEDSFLSDEAKESVIKAFMHTRFNPGRLAGIAVKSQLTIVVNLQPALPPPS